MNWDKYFIEIAQVVLRKSKDQSTKVGAVVVNVDNHILATGYNGFPRGIDDTNPEYHERPLKYQVTEHAERNAIYQAAANRGGLKGSTLYLGHNPFSGICSDCARAIIQAGIVCVVGPDDVAFEGRGNQWHQDCRVARDLLREAGVEVRSIL